ncbi:sodium/potassium-transporting ATPase subunit beta-1-like [Mytilus trossulus]|uniref:sodium/potassium-transporting ATPase subunit beta-1-like n=1 Tax=Mytilus trossulus TaxID=6551 RepID=UPI0030056B2C
MADKKESIGDKARACGKFFCNTEDGTVMGRGAKSWAGIGIFYVIYYICLSGFFAAALAIFYQLVDDKEPRLMGADSLLKANPALGYRPMPGLKTTLVRFTDDPKSYQQYIDHLDTFLKPYTGTQEGAIDCPGDNSPRNPSAHDKACKVDVSTFGDCEPKSGTKYGYNDGSPCMLIKLNKVYGWQPEAYSDKLNDTAALPDAIKGLYKDYMVTVKCAGQNPADVDNLGPVTYYPAGGLAYKYFPYLNQDGYLSPVVMVKFNRPKVQTLLMIECRAYARNIKYDKVELDGAVHYEMMVDIAPRSNGTGAAGK